MIIKITMVMMMMMMVMIIDADLECIRTFNEEQNNPTVMIMQNILLKSVAIEHVCNFLVSMLDLLQTEGKNLEKVTRIVQSSTMLEGERKIRELSNNDGKEF